MTAEEWIQFTHPIRMLNELSKDFNISDRKYRLYSCEVARVLNNSVTDKNYEFEIIQNQMKAESLPFEKRSNCWWINPEFNPFCQAKEAAKSKPCLMSDREFTDLFLHFFGNRMILP